MARGDTKNVLLSNLYRSSGIGFAILAAKMHLGLAMIAGAPTVQFGMLPWTGSTLLYTLFFGALLGLATVILAIKATWRPLFFVWSLVVTLLLLKGYIFSGYHFSEGEFPKALYLMVGSVIALMGAWVQMGRKVAARR